MEIERFVGLVVSPLFAGAGWTLFLSVLLTFYKKESFKEKNLVFFDSATLVIRITGILWLVVISFQISSEINKPYIEGNYRFSNAMFGPYWYAYWFWLFSFCLLPQLFWIDRMKQSSFTRFLFAVVILFAVYLELLIIFITSYHRDYLPSSWATNYFRIVVITFVKTGFFVLVTFVVYFLKRKKEKPAIKASTVLDEE